MENLKDKVAVVFAASGEIAGAVARSLSQHGAKVYVTARNLDAVKTLAAALKADGGKVEAAKVDSMVKHLLNDARNIMTDIYEHRCALINKNGVCDQCSHLNGIFNPKQDEQEQLMKLELVKESKKFDRAELFKLRTVLVQAIDPLQSSGTDLHDKIMRCTRAAIGDVDSFFDPPGGDEAD
jgi:short chain dehydrogenase